MVLRSMGGYGPEQVHLIKDTEAGLEGTIVVHSTALGPAAGGCRLWRYPDRNDMTADACRLAEGMTYKNAVAGLPLGGGKAVIQMPQDPSRRRALFEAFGRAVRALEGAYITAEDVGTTVQDMSIVAEHTRHVAGLPPVRDAAGGDPSPWTARGVFLAMREAVRLRLQRDLSDCTVAIQGVGNVGSALAHMLKDAGAKLVVADLDSVSAARVAVAVGAELASVNGILSCKADVFAPCALGGVLNHRSIGKLAAKVVCGAANNQLQDADDAARLADRAILYAPDFVVNAGGIINVAAEYLHWHPSEVGNRVDLTPSRLREVFDLADKHSLSTHAAAEMLARRIIAGGSSDRAAA